MATSAKLLELIQGNTVEAMQANEEAARAAQEGANKAAELSQAAAAALRADAEAKSILIREQLLAQQKVEQAQRKAALAAGYDPATASGEIFDRIQRINKGGAEVTNLSRKLQAERSASLFTDPAAWIHANFLSDTEDQLSGAAQILQQEAANLQNLNAAVQQTAQTAVATAQTVTEARLVAAQKAAATDSTLRALQAEQEGIGHRVAAITARASLSNTQLNALHTLRGAVMAEQNYKLNLQQEARIREQFEWQKEQRRIEQEVRNTEKSVEGYMMETINYGNRLLGRPEFSGIEAKAMVQLLKKGGTEELNKLYQIGMSYRTNPANPIIGQDPNSALENILNLNGRVTAAQREVVSVLAQVKKDLPQQYKDPKTGQVDVAAYNKAVDNVFKQSFNNIRAGTGNPFDVGDLTAYVGSDPKFGSPTFNRTVLLPAIEAKQTLADPAIVVGLAMEAVKAKQLSMNQAIAGLVTTYQRANQINQTAKGFVSFGVVPPGGGLSYNAVLDGSSVNLTDPVSVSRYMSVQLSKQFGDQSAAKFLFKE